MRMGILLLFQTIFYTVNAGRIAEDPLNCAIIAREVGAIQQLILMALSDNEVVVEQACKVIGEPPFRSFVTCSVRFPI